LKVCYASRRRKGISELVGSLLAIAITITAGAAVFGYVNGQSAVTEKQYGQGVGAVVNQIQEKFTVFDLSFPSSNSISVWIYNTGSLTLQLSSIRVYNSSGSMSLGYNYTTSGQTKTDYVYDLKGTSACKIAAASYESQPISSVSDNMRVTQLVTLTMPPTRSGCPSYGHSFVSGKTYSVTVLGLYGNVETASQVK